MDSCTSGECCGAKETHKGKIVLPGTDRHDLAWKFYNHLIGGIPEDVFVTRVCAGTHWTYVEAESGMGTSMTTRGGSRRVYTGQMNGLRLCELAQLSKSWNFTEATIGVAALNAWYAQPEKIEALGALYDPTGSDDECTYHKADVFEVLMPDMIGKKVAVIGHFPRVEKIAEVAELTVLERNCESSIDTPDPACEYVLPVQDMVFMTGVTIINKTAPRLFDLSKQAQTILVGPSTIPSEFVLSWGVDVIAGSVVTDPEKTRLLVEQGAGMLFGDALRMFRIDRRNQASA